MGQIVNELIRIPSGLPRIMSLNHLPTSSPKSRPKIMGSWKENEVAGFVVFSQ